MNTEHLVNLKKLASRLTKEGKSVFGIWIATAHEVCREKYREIDIVRSSYSDIPDAELSERHFRSFVEALVDTMPTLEHKKALLRAEAFVEREFERTDEKA